MNIAVFDVPAESGGALSVLSEFHNEVLCHENKMIQWFFILSTPNLESADNVKILNFPWIKKSWLHRLYFDYFVAPRLVKKIKVDKIFSLQNVVVPRTKIEQIIYMHQSLPFVDYNFTWKESKISWIYQNVISKKIYSSIKLSQKAIVQANWIKKACIEETGVSEEKLIVVQPQVKMDVKNEDKFSETEESFSTFFYPASFVFYKNHGIVLEVAKLLKDSGITRYKVIFTLDPNKCSETMKMYYRAKDSNLPIEFIGNITRSEVCKYYQKSILLFPSYVETFGLPILEAKLHESPIIVADCSFAHEILEGYPNVYYFDPFNAIDLYEKMKFLISNRKYYTVEQHQIELISEDIIDVILETK